MSSTTPSSARPPSPQVLLIVWAALLASQVIYALMAFKGLASGTPSPLPSEMVLILSGEVVLVEDEETILRAGDAACWPAGLAIGHRLDNRSDAPARYLVIGTRHVRDVIHYTDHDLVTHKDGPSRRYLHRDGTPWAST